MKLLNVVIGILGLLLLVLVGVAGFLLLSIPSEEQPDKSPPLFSVLETGTAADSGYAIYNFRGKGNLTVLGMEKEPRNEIVILNDSEALEASRLPELISDLKKLEAYGYEVAVSDKPGTSGDILVVPTGALPSYMVFSLQYSLQNSTVIYIGEKDLIISRGVKTQNWYDTLPADAKDNMVIFDGTLNEFLEEGRSLNDLILYEHWNQEGNTTVPLTGSGLRTVALDMDEARYLRIIYHVDGLEGVYDSNPLSFEGQRLQPSPASMFSWEKSDLRFSLNRTNGTAYISVSKDGKEIEREVLRRVTDSNVFLKRLQYTEPGDYVIEVSDNSGVIASALLHVKDLQINLKEKRGYTYLFSVSVDGRPLSDTTAMVSLGNSSEKRKYFVSDGDLIVSAKLDKGKNVFYMDILGSTVPVTVLNNEESIFEFYFKYGLPGIALVLFVYFGARISRKPTFRLRFGEASTSIREEIRIPQERALDSFRRIRDDMNLGKSPITPQEFSISIKRYLTNGADVTEGNVEEILKKLVVCGHLETHRDYYQLRGEGDVRRNTLCRMIREKLIENGIMFTEKGDKFMTKNYEIGFFGAKFSKKGIMVVDDELEARRIQAGLSDKEQAELKIMQANGMITIVPVDKLGTVL